jgi:integrase
LDRPKVCWYPDLPELPDHEQRWFTQEEINRIVDAAPGQYKMLFRLAGFTGLRCGELCGLRVEDVKLGDGVVEVHRSVWNGVEGRTKTKAGRRTVFLDSVTLEMLRAYVGTRTIGRLFQSSRGTPLVNREIPCLRSNRYRSRRDARLPPRSGKPYAGIGYARRLREEPDWTLQPENHEHLHAF